MNTNLSIEKVKELLILDYARVLNKELYDNKTITLEIYENMEKRLLNKYNLLLEKEKNYVQ